MFFSSFSGLIGKTCFLQTEKAAFGNSLALMQQLELVL